MDPDVDITVAEPTPRPVGRALLRGWRRRCPQCGGGPMMARYLKIRDTCAACGLDLKHHKADDMPAWATIIVVGHLVVGAMFSTEVHFSPPVWVHWAVWPALTLLLSLWFLPRLKGIIVALQWAWRMHGFEED